VGTTYLDQQLTHAIIGAAIEVHRHLGPGLLESAYQWCLEMEFKDRGWTYQREHAIPLTYRNRRLDCGFRCDFLVENQVVLELKSIESLLPIHRAQLLTYLRLLDKTIGLLINFNEPVLKKGICRCVLGRQNHLSSSGQGPDF
jgi:GxxExxY protein